MKQTKKNKWKTWLGCVGILAALCSMVACPVVPPSQTEPPPSEKGSFFEPSNESPLSDSSSSKELSSEGGPSEMLGHESISIDGPDRRSAADAGEHVAVDAAVSEASSEHRTTQDAKPIDVQRSENALEAAPSDMISPPEIPREVDPTNDPNLPVTATDRNQKKYQLDSYQKLFGAGAASDTPLQRHRKRLLDGYWDAGSIGNPRNAESRAHLMDYFQNKTGKTAADWDLLSAAQQRDFGVLYRVGLWNHLTMEERSTFLSITKALVQIAILDASDKPKVQINGMPLTALDYVASLNDIHGQTTGPKGDPQAPDMGEFRLGVRYTQEGQQWLVSAGRYAQMDDSGQVKQRENAKRHGTHSTHKGFDDWGATANTPNLQWQYRKADVIGEIDIDYDHHSIWFVFAGTQGNSDILTTRTLWPATKDHLEQFQQEYGDLGIFRLP